MNENLKQKLSKLTTKSGVYVMKDADQNVIYVGKAKNLKNRVSQYFNKKNVYDGYTLKVKTMVDKICDFEYFITLSEQDALALENNLIKKHQPFFNILLKDSKTYPYIKLTTKQDFPKVEVVRKVKNDGNKYFGPYFAGVRAHDLVDVINAVFQLRTCNLKINQEKPAKRECLNYNLGLCNAPCTNKVDKKEYAKEVAKVVEFLNGNETTVIKILEEKMTKYAESENFEKALDLREKLKMIKTLSQNVVAEVPKNINIDVFCYATNNMAGALSVVNVRSGKIVGVQNISTIDASLEECEILSTFIMQYYESAVVPSLILTSHQLNNVEDLEILLGKGKKVEIKTAERGYKKHLVDMCLQNATEHLEKATTVERTKFNNTIGALQNLKSQLNLKHLPKRIECYDISNTQGTNSVASMTVAINGELAKKHYRKFKIQSVDGPNDFASLCEVMTRRLNELEISNDESFSQKPDLILIDGGKGQLSCTSEVVFAKRKDIEMASLAEKFDEVFLPNSSQPIMLKRASVELRLLQNLRDEAHRFAITFHRNLRSKAMTKSPLDEISGIGEVKKKALIKQFKTIDKIKNASVEELALVKGINKNLALDIFEYFHNKENS